MIGAPGFATAQLHAAVPAVYYHSLRRGRISTHSLTVTTCLLLFRLMVPFDGLTLISYVLYRSTEESATLKSCLSSLTFLFIIQRCHLGVEVVAQPT